MHMAEHEVQAESAGKNVANESKPKLKAEDQLLKGKKKIHLSYQDFDFK